MSYTKSGLTVTVNVASNSGPARSGNIDIGAITLPVNQACGNYPATAGAITGTNSVCPGQTAVEYNVGAISGATGYSWTLPTGATIASGSNTNSITVNYSSSAASGNITVRGTGCGTGNPSPNYGVTVNSISQPGGISGTTSVCEGSTQNYIVSPVADAVSYTWTKPSGASGSSTTNSIDITFSQISGIISVTATNGAGCASATSSLSVNVNYLNHYTVNGGGTTCPGVGIPVSLQGSTNGIVYKLYLNGSWQSGDMITGNGGNNVTWNKSYPGTYTIKGVVNGCEIPMYGSATISNYAQSTNPTGISATVNPVCQGSNTMLSQTGGALGYNANWVWYSGDPQCGSALVSSGTSPSITVAPQSTTKYWVKAVGTCNTTPCVSTDVTVLIPPTITQQPSGVTVCDGAPTSFSISVTGATSYQWQNLIGGTWNDISGATSTTYSISNTTGMDGRGFRCIVTGSCNFTTTSNIAVIHFSYLYPYTVHSTNSLICPGDPNEITLDGSDPNSNIIYKCYLNGSELSQQPVHGTGGPISLGPHNAPGVYTVKGVNTDGCLIPMNGSATLTVRTPSTPADSINATSKSICPGQSTVLSIRGGSLEAGYGSWQWHSGSAPCGSTAEGYGTTSITVSPTVTTTYFVRAEGGCTTYTSCVSKTVIVKELPIITAQPVNSNVVLNQDASFNVTATGTNLQYQWQSSPTGVNPWNNLTGSPAKDYQTANLKIDKSAIFESKFYRCRITSDCEIIYTDSAKIIVEAGYLEGSELPDPNRSIDVTKLVGTTAVSTSVNQMGAATINIPVFSSPGTSGMAPSVSLFYNSQSSNGILGYGWHISGLSDISRTGKTMFNDNEVTGVYFTGSDRFTRNGERLMLSIGTYGLDNSVYHSESSPFSKITAYGSYGNGPSYFKEETKDGTILEYGNTQDSKLFPVNISGSVYSWLINKAKDINGNYIKYNYENLDGDHCLRSIEYTGNSVQALQPYDSLVFHYSTRTSDKSLFYLAGGYLSNQKLLKQIIIYCEGIIAKKYDFSYTDGLYSNLVKIIENDKDSSIYNPVVIKWGAKGTLTERYESQISRYSVEEGIETGDYNGDGSDDLVLWGNDSIDAGISFYEMSYGSFQKIFEKVFPIDKFTSLSNRNKFNSVSDMNGDGIDDLILFSDDSLFVFMGNSSNQLVFNNEVAYPTTGFTKFFPGDFNGDGVGEILMIGSGNAVIHSFSEDQTWNVSIPQSSYYKFVDFDGDGKTDLLTLINGGYTLTRFIYNSTTHQYSTSQVGTYISSLMNDQINARMFEGDFNGDGNTDFLIKGYPEWYIMYSTGTQYINNETYACSVPDSFNPFTSSNGHALYVRDINKDGRSDIIEVSNHYANGNIDGFIMRYHLSKGMEFKTEYNQWIHDAPLVNSNDFQFGYYYGDGQLDCLYLMFRSFKLKENDRTNLVSSVVNGLNHRTDFIYDYNVKPSTLLARQELDTLLYKPFSQFIVSSLISTGSDHRHKSLNYSYSNPFYHLKGKGFLGFANQTVTDNTTAFESTYSSNADERYVYSYPSEQTVKDGNGNTLSEQNFVNSNKSFDYGSYFTYTSRIISRDILHNLTDTIFNYYDSYGNDTLTIYKQNGELVTTNRNQFIQKGSWCPARISSATVTKSSCDSKPAFQTFSKYGYDNNGQLTRTSVYVNLADSLSTGFTYNNFGNILSKTISMADGKKRYESYIYETKNRFATGLTKGNLNYSCNNDPVIGVVLNETLPNGLTKTYQYDGAGRQTKEEISSKKYVSTKYDWSIGSVGAAIYTISQKDDQMENISWFDDSGRVIRDQTKGFDGNSIYIDKQYSIKGSLTQESKPYFNGSTPINNTFSYDTLGRIESFNVNGSILNQ